MPDSTTMAPPAQEAPPRHYSPMAAVLSYLVPGLGQIYQGRVGKGLLFFICLYGMFFYGMYLGRWSNVYMVVVDDRVGLGSMEVVGVHLGPTLSAIGHRPQFAGQFWIGMAAWPAIWQYTHHDGRDQDSLLGRYQRMPMENPDRDKPHLLALNDLQRDSDKSWDLAWVYTVIAGVLNILVIYDAFAGPAFVAGEEPMPAGQPEGNLA